MNSAEFKNLDALMKAVADVVREHIAKEVEPLKVKLAELEAISSNTSGIIGASSLSRPETGALISFR